MHHHNVEMTASDNTHIQNLTVCLFFSDDVYILIIVIQMMYSHLKKKTLKHTFKQSSLWI